MPRNKNKGKVNNDVNNVKKDDDAKMNGGYESKVSNKTTDQKNTDEGQDTNMAVTNKPFVKEGGANIELTRQDQFKAMQAVEADDTLERVFINGDKATLSIIDGKGKSIHVSPEDSKPEIIGDGVIPKVLKNETVYSRSSYTPKSSLISDINLVLAPPVDILLKFPKLVYKSFNKVPIHIKYIKLLRRTLKIIYNPLIRINYEDYASFVNLMNALISNWRTLVENYDVIWTDFEADTDFSIVTDKRILRNLSITDDDWKQPMNVVKDIEGQVFNYDQIMSRYFTTNVPLKDSINNVRVNNSYMIDKHSMVYLNYLTRPPIRNTSRGWELTDTYMGLPYDFKYGYPSDNEIRNFYNGTTNTSHYINERPQSLYINPSVEKRSIYLNLDLTDGRIERVKGLLRSYDVLFDKFNSFKGVLRNSFLSSIEFAQSTVNKLSEYYGQTEFGISALRRTATTAVIMSLAPATVPGFINSILELYFEPRTSLIFQLNAQYSVNWTFNAVLFMFLMKPQVCSRGSVKALLDLVVANLCKVFGFNYVTTPAGIMSLGGAVSGLMINILNDWYNYSQSPLNVQADHAALFTNFGMAGQRGDSINPQNIDNASGYRFWGSGAIMPWARYPNTHDDGVFITDISQLFTARVKYSWVNVWNDLVMSVTNNREYNFVTCMHRLIVTLNLFATSELNFNRFATGVRDKVVEIDHRSILSFAMYSRVSDVPFYHSNLQVFYLSLLSLDYYLSQAAMFSTVFKRIEATLVPIAGLSNISATFFKQWDMINLIGSYCEHPIVKDIFSNISYENINSLSFSVGGFALQPRNLLSELENLYAGDLNTNRVSRWFIDMRAIDIVLDPEEWRKFGLEQEFKVGKVDLVIQGNDIFKVKDTYRPITGYVNYRQNYFKFGDFTYQRILNRTHPISTIGYKVPTFVEYKIVDKLTDTTSFKATTGETSVKEWMYTAKDPVTSDNYRIDCVKLVRELVVQWEKDYQYETLFFDSYTAIAGNSYFINEHSRSDVDDILLADVNTSNFYLDELTDISVEFNSIFSNPNSERLGFTSRFRNYIAIV